MRREVDAHELLDGALTDPTLLDGNLRDLRRINRLFGGTALSIRALRTLVSTTGRLHLLDVGTGAADIPIALGHARGPWASIRVTAVDNRPEILAAARRVSPALSGSEDVLLAVADGRSLPFDDDQFDVAHASLVLHHLEPLVAVAFLRELARVASLGIVVNDLRRGALHWLGAWLVLHAMTRNPWTLHDGPLSVRRAYTPSEVRALLAEAGLRTIAEVHGFAHHRWAIAAVPR
jgi:ubiquinone/menaquinone biosynthesis C-methylase UbiE